MKKHFTHIAKILLVTGMVVLNSCNKSDDANYYEYQTGGSIKGTLSANMEGEDLTDESLNYSCYESKSADSYYYQDDDDYYHIYVERYSKDFESYISIKLTCTASFKIEYAYVTVSYTKEKDTKIFEYEGSMSGDGDNSSSGDEVLINDFSFDPATGKVKATFDATERNSNDVEQSNVTGTLDATVYEIVNDSY